MLTLATLDPAPWYREMRTTTPVFYDPQFSFFFGATGGWQLFRYEDVKRAFMDYETFSSQYMPPSGGDILTASLMTTDPPRHRDLRSLISKAFAPATISQLEPWLYATSEMLLKPLLEKGKMEFVRDIASPLPNLVLARLLGVPGMQAYQVSRWSKAITGDPLVIGMEVYHNTMQEMSEFLLALIEERRRFPRQDLISELLVAGIAGEQLTTKEILACCITLLGAGTETTEAWLMIAMQLLIEYPWLQQRLAAHPEDIPKALQEVLRFRSPVMAMPRKVTRDVEIGGQLLRKDDLVNLMIAAANRDPAVFSHPDEFDIDRENSKQLGFGYGIHYCIGNILARIEARIIFETLFKYCRNFRLPQDASLERHPSTFVYSFPALPVLFDKR